MASGAVENVVSPAVKKSISEEDWSETALDMEIEKMSKDADAILESLREVAGASPPPKQRKKAIAAPISLEARARPLDEKPLSLSTFLDKDTPPNQGPQENYDTDDDMSDTGTVSSLVKRELGDALQEAEKEFTAHQENRAATKATEENVRIDESLILLMTVVWSLVIFIASFASRYMLDDHGRVVFPFFSS